MKYIILLLLPFLIGCEESDYNKKMQAGVDAHNAMLAEKAKYFSRRFYKTEFDRHKYIVLDGISETSFIHSPDCICGRPR